ncbi:hypothetical protein SGLAM104S_07033 [Streptomyces glaucescens]
MPVRSPANGATSPATPCANGAASPAHAVPERRDPAGDAVRQPGRTAAHPADGGGDRPHLVSDPVSTTGWTAPVTPCANGGTSSATPSAKPPACPATPYPNGATSAATPAPKERTSPVTPWASPPASATA